ncbi:MAG TPA: hypothetical protein VFU81_09625, partial [Thermomicrobiales bacterium]|nr:hypothetical protein [Thermomicrobiales bacterium]
SPASTSPATAEPNALTARAIAIDAAFRAGVSFGAGSGRLADYLEAQSAATVEMAFTAGRARAVACWRMFARAVQALPFFVAFGAVRLVPARVALSLFARRSRGARVAARRHGDGAARDERGEAGRCLPSRRDPGQ